MKRLDPHSKGPAARLQVDIQKSLLDRMDKLDKRFKESGIHYYRAALARHLIDLGLRCYEESPD